MRTLPVVLVVSLAVSAIPALGGEPDSQPKLPHHLIWEALDGKGEGDKPSGREVVAELTKNYEVESQTREWEILDFMGQRAWEDCARRVARKYPDAVREAAQQSTGVAEKYVLILGDVGGDENVDLLVRLCNKCPTWNRVIALGRTKSPKAHKQLRRVMLLDKDPKYILAGLAAEILAQAGDRQISPTLKTWLAGDCPRRKQLAVHAANLLGDPELAAALRKLEAGTPDKDRYRLYRALVSCGDDRHLDKVHKVALDESQYLADEKEESPDPAIPVINWNYRQREALEAIAKLGSPRSLPVLDKLRAKAADRRVRIRATAIAKAIRKAAAQSSKPSVGG